MINVVCSIVCIDVLCVFVFKGLCFPLLVVICDTRAEHIIVLKLRLDIVYDTYWPITYLSNTILFPDFWLVIR